MSSMLLEKISEIALEGMKRQYQIGNKHIPVVDVSGGESKVQCCKEQYWKGTWNVRFMNQGKLEVINMRLQE